MYHSEMTQMLKSSGRGYTAAIITMVHEAQLNTP